VKKTEAGAAGCQAPPGVAFLGADLRGLVRPRSRGTAHSEGADAAAFPRGRGPRQDPGAYRPPVDAGITGGMTLLFGMNDDHRSGRR
jgi:hypothetical protein